MAIKSGAEAIRAKLAAIRRGQARIVGDAAGVGEAKISNWKNGNEPINPELNTLEAGSLTS